jgi:hypothetical protein
MLQTPSATPFHHNTMPMPIIHCFCGGLKSGGFSIWMNECPFSLSLSPSAICLKSDLARTQIDDHLRMRALYEGTIIVLMYK